MLEMENVHFAMVGVKQPKKKRRKNYEFSRVSWMKKKMKLEKWGEGGKAEI